MGGSGRALAELGAEPRSSSPAPRSSLPSQNAGCHQGAISHPLWAQHLQPRAEPASALRARLGARARCGAPGQRSRRINRCLQLLRLRPPASALLPTINAASELTWPAQAAIVWFTSPWGCCLQQGTELDVGWGLGCRCQRAAPAPAPCPTSLQPQQRWGRHGRCCSPLNYSTTPSLDVPRKPAGSRGCRMVNHKAAFDMGEPAQRIIKSFPKAALLNYGIRQKRKRGLFQKSGTGSSC